MGACGFAAWTARRVVGAWGLFVEFKGQSALIMRILTDT